MIGLNPRVIEVCIFMATTHTYRDVLNFWKKTYFRMDRVKSKSVIQSTFLRGFYSNVE